MNFRVAKSLNRFKTISPSKARNSTQTWAEPQSCNEDSTSTTWHKVWTKSRWRNDLSYEIRSNIMQIIHDGVSKRTGLMTCCRTQTPFYSYRRCDLLSLAFTRYTPTEPNVILLHQAMKTVELEKELYQSLWDYNHAIHEQIGYRKCYSIWY